MQNLTFNIVVQIVVSLIIGYLFGSIPNAVIVSKLKGTNIRKVGSGNPGAANVAREVGKIWGIIVFVLDAGKAVIPMLIADKVLHLNLFWVGVTGLFVVMGHCYSPFLNFKGGKGMASFGGLFLYLFPKFFLVAIGGYFVIQRNPRSLKTVLAVYFLALGLWIWLYWNSMPLFIPFLLISLMVGILLNIDVIKELKGGNK